MPLISLDKLHSLIVDNPRVFHLAKADDVVVHSRHYRPQDIFSTMCDMIRGARHEVLINFYSMSFDSEPVQAMIEAIKALNGSLLDGHQVRVHLLLNKKPWFWRLVGKKETAPTVLEDIAKALKSCRNIQLEFDYYKPKLAGTNHQKFVVVDGVDVLLLSGNMTSTSNYKQLAARSDRNCAIYFSSPKLAETIREDFIVLRQRPLVVRRAEVADIDRADDAVDALYISTRGHETGGQEDQIGPFGQALILAIDSAEAQIRIVTSNLNDQEIMDALVRAIKRGVKVDIVLSIGMNKDTVNRALFAGKGYRGGDNYKTINRICMDLNKEQLQNLNVRWFVDSGGQLVIAHPARECLHQKCVIVDGRLVFVGSSPLDVQAMRTSIESNAVFDSAELARQYNDELITPLFDAGASFSSMKIILLVVQYDVGGLLKQVQKRLAKRETEHLLLFSKDRKGKARAKYAVLERSIQALERCHTPQEVYDLVSALFDNQVLMQHWSGVSTSAKELLQIFDMTSVEFCLKQASTVARVRVPRHSLKRARKQERTLGSRAG